MTLSMIITLAIVVLMVAVIISDKLPFGAPALIACALLVVTQQADVATAFSVFANNNVIMIMGFMVCTAALQKTTAIHKIKGLLNRVAKKGGVGGFVLLLFTIMVVGNFITGTAFYVLIISIIATIPYNKELPTSRILLPAAFCSSGWLPNGAAMMIGIIASLVETTGHDGSISVAMYCLVNVAWSAVYLLYCVVMHRFLPDRDISESTAAAAKEEDKFELTITKTQEKIIYVGYVVLLIGLVFLTTLPGEIGYGLPLVIAGVYLACGAISFKEMLNNMFSPVLIMMASVIGVAAAMNNSGLSTYLGNLVGGLMGENLSLFVLVLVFGFMTSICATFTGASFGSLFIFAPIGIALSVSYGYSPIPVAYVCVAAAWINWFMPIDGLPALAMGTGKYKLTEFWTFILPLWVLKMLFTCGAACLLFA